MVTLLQKALQAPLISAESPPEPCGFSMCFTPTATHSCVLQTTYMHASCCRCLQVIHAQMALWVSGVVLFTLTVNAPLLGPLMASLGLNKTTPLQRKLHRCVRVLWLTN
jgi:hypothetical protein